MPALQGCGEESLSVQGTFTTVERKALDPKSKGVSSREEPAQLPVCGCVSFCICIYVHLAISCLIEASHAPYPSSPNKREVCGEPEFTWPALRVEASRWVPRSKRGGSRHGQSWGVRAEPLGEGGMWG